MEKGKLKQWIKRVKKAIKIAFYRKRIVYSTKHKPAVMIKPLEHEGKRYIRVAFDNRIKYEGHIPILDIPSHQVTGIRYNYSPAEVFLWSLLGVKVDNKNRPVKRIKNK